MFSFIPRKIIEIRLIFISTPAIGLKALIQNCGGYLMSRSFLLSILNKKTTTGAQLNYINGKLLKANHRQVFYINPKILILPKSIRSSFISMKSYQMVCIIIFRRHLHPAA